MVLHFGDHDFIAFSQDKPLRFRIASAGSCRLHCRIQEAIGDQIQGLSCVLGEDQITCFRADEPRNRSAGGFISVGCLFRQLVGTPVNCRITAFQEPPFGVEHLLRLLRSSAGVQVNQPLFVAHRTTQDRKVRPDRSDVQLSHQTGSRVNCS